MRNLIIVALLLGPVAAAQAVLIAQEPFNYPAGSSLTGASGGSGWSLGWAGQATVTSPGLTYPNYGASGNKVTTNANNVGANRPLASTLGTDGTTVWVSFLGNLATADGTDAYAGVSFFSGVNEILFMGKRFNQGFWGFERTGGGTTQGVNSAEAADTTSTDLLLYKIDFAPGAFDQVTMYVNPDLSNLGALVPAAGPLAVNNMTNLDRIRIQSGTGTFAQANFDELRIGTDVQSVAFVPEPSVLGLIGAAMVGLLARRRR